jgi:hypothetical protein
VRINKRYKVNARAKARFYYFPESGFRVLYKQPLGTPEGRYLVKV